MLSDLWAKRVTLLCVALLWSGCRMEYSILRGTGLRASPEEPVPVLVGRFPVRSTATRNLLRWEKNRESCPGALGQAREAPKVKRALPFDRLDKEIRDALSEDQVRVLDLSAPPSMLQARAVPNPFRLTDKSEAVLEIEGRISVNSRDLRNRDCTLAAHASRVKETEPLFSEDIRSFDVYVVLTDLRTSKMVAEVAVNRPARIPFGSSELREVLVASVMAVLTERTPF
jgi:hypothetical protein